MTREDVQTLFDFLTRQRERTPELEALVKLARKLTADKATPQAALALRMVENVWEMNGDDDHPAYIELADGVEAAYNKLLRLCPDRGVTSAALAIFGA
jgi:hypothetical protein